MAAAILPQTTVQSPCDAAPWSLDTQAAVFHFDSENALRAGIDRARCQSWVADYFVDELQRTLWVRFRGGSEATPVRRSPPNPAPAAAQPCYGSAPMTAPDLDTAGRRGPLLLFLGASVGVLLAAVSVLAPSGSDGLVAAEIARVNDAGIGRDEFDRSIERLAADKRNPVSEEDRAHVLRRIIEEELLIQRGVEMGLVASDRTVRKSIASAMIQSILAEVEGEAPADGTLRDFFAENRGYFTTPARIRARRIVFKEDGQARAHEAVQALRAGADFEEVAERFGDEPVLPLPDAPLPLHKLREYLGPTVTNMLLTLEPGTPSAPVVTQTGVQVLLVREIEEAPPPRFEDFRPQIEAEYRRRAGDQALREYLDWLWDEADVRLAADAPR